MFKTLIAGLTAMSLTLTSAAPAQAETMNQDDVGKLLFGILATAVVIGMVSNTNDDKDDARTEREHRQDVPRIGRAPIAPYFRQDMSPYDGKRNDHAHQPNWQSVLPQSCVQHVQTGRRPIAILQKNCTQNTYRYTASLPRQCEIRIVTRGRAVNGWSPECLSNRGYRISNRF